MYMRFKDGKSKVLTLSYDDGVVQDIRLINIMNKYGLRGTFNINTGRYLPENFERKKMPRRMKFSEALECYSNSRNEVAVHGMRHLDLTLLNTQAVISEVIEDRKNIEKQFGVFARGMAYPYGSYNSEVVDCLKKCGICYCRTAESTNKFDLPENWLLMHPTCHHNEPKLMEIAKEFIEGKIWHSGNIRMFCLWGHSYEFDNDDNWDVFENFASYCGGREDVWYATNIEIYDYVCAFKNLIFSIDEKKVYNPSVIDVWINQNEQIYCVKAGQILFME